MGITVPWFVPYRGAPPAGVLSFRGSSTLVPFLYIGPPVVVVVLVVVVQSVSLVLDAYRLLHLDSHERSNSGNM